MEPKKVIIVGASSGIGKEVASIYAERGWEVAITGRRKNLLEEVKQKYPSIIYSSFDVMANDNVEHITALIEEMGGLDLLIYNSGYGDTSKSLDPEIERTTILTNVVGFVDIVGYAFNYFVNQGRGQIAITSSIAAFRGNSWAPAYSASKSFMSNYAEGLNIKAERLKKNIVISDMKPGFVDTKLAKGNKRFWTASAEKAAKQIVNAIDKKKKEAYVTKRWWLIAKIMKILPYWLYKRLG